MEGDHDEFLPKALSAMSIDDGPARRSAMVDLNTGGSNSGSLAGVIDGERYQHHSSDYSRQEPMISPPSSHAQAGHSSRPSSVAQPQHHGVASPLQQQQQQQQSQPQLPQITIDDIPLDMREAFLQLEPDQQALASEMLAQQKLEQQRQMEEEAARPDEHFLTVALNGKREKCGWASLGQKRIYIGCSCDMYFFSSSTHFFFFSNHPSFYD